MKIESVQRRYIINIKDFPMIPSHIYDYIRRGSYHANKRSKRVNELTGETAYCLGLQCLSPNYPNYTAQMDWIMGWKQMRDEYKIKGYKTQKEVTEFFKGKLDNINKIFLPE